ncbi:hypothetical protein HW555_002985 [Spodoptera exigua]|uniref:Uncharacterized protein n=1 Tax=Spodoptera exigua TaxID=7107 RepID=A0A835GPY3_SPOEX|nr:hypothetical protein HW555_002985 [Spodoptera exigua]
MILLANIHGYIPSSHHAPGSAERSALTALHPTEKTNNLMEGCSQSRWVTAPRKRSYKRSLEHQDQTRPGDVAGGHAARDELPGACARLHARCMGGRRHVLQSPATQAASRARHVRDTGQSRVSMRDPQLGPPWTTRTRTCLPGSMDQSITDVINLPQVLGQGDHGIQASTLQPRRQRTVHARRDAGRRRGAQLSFPHDISVVLYTHHVAHHLSFFNARLVFITLVHGTIGVF